MSRRKPAAIVVVLLCIALASCSTSRRDFDEALSSGRCEDALESIPEDDAGVRLAGKTRQGARTVLSYSLTGASYSAQIAWDTLGRTAMFVALCGPGLALSAAASATGGQGDIAEPCLDGNFGALDAPSLGANTFAGTKDLRCPDLVPLSRSVQQVAACYRARGDAGSLASARSTLVALQSSGSFFECLPQAERDEIARAIRELEVAPEPGPPVP